MSGHNEAWVRYQMANSRLDQANDLMARYAERFVDSDAFAAHWVESMREHVAVLRACRADVDVARARYFQAVSAPQRVVLGPVGEDYVREMAS